MASTHTRPRSTQQQVSLILPDNRRVSRSLHTSDPHKASQIGEKLQTLVDTLTGEDKARQTVLRVLVEDIFIAASVPNPWAESEEEAPLFGDFYKSFIDRKETTPKNKMFLQITCLGFAQFVGNLKLSTYTGSDCQKWYDAITSEITAATAKNKLSAVSSVFAQAVKLGVIGKNPCVGLQVKQPEDSSREELTDEEVAKVLAWLDLQSTSGKLPWQKRMVDWKMAVLLARYAGCRLGDAVKMSLTNVTKAGDAVVMSFLCGKTKKIVTVPVMGPLLDALSHFGGELICPSLANQSIESLSAEFGEILDEAGIDTGKHVVNGRTLRNKSFHGFRRRFVNWLVEIGAPEDLRMAIAGHSSKRSHKIYVNTDGASLAARMKPFLQQVKTAISHLKQTTTTSTPV